MSERNKAWHKRFFIIWVPQQLSVLGSAVAQFALVWWVTDTTGSATVLGTASMIAMMPQVISGPIIGALVDRWDRRRIMMSADTFVALAAAWVAYLFWRDALHIWHIYVLMFARSLGGSFHFPAMQASTAMLVPDEHLARVNGLNQTLGGAVNVIGPPIGALLLSLMPLHWLMGIDVVTALMAVLPLFFITIPQPQRSREGCDETRTIWHDTWEGLRFIWHWRGLADILVVAMLTNLFSTPAMVLIPILVTRHYGGGATQLAWMQSAWGIGVIAGGLLLGVWGGFRRRIITMLAGVIGLGLGFLAVGLSPAKGLYIGLAGTLLGAAMNAMCNGSAYSMMQELIPNDFQGRLFSLVASLTTLMSPIGMAIAGPVADLIDIRYLYLTAAVAQILLGAAGFLRPAIMQIEAQRHSGRDNTQGGEAS